jgi:hypothetical protein
MNERELRGSHWGILEFSRALASFGASGSGFRDASEDIRGLVQSLLAPNPCADSVIGPAANAQAACLLRLVVMEASHYRSKKQ